MKIIFPNFNHFSFFHNKEVDALHFTLSLIQFATGLAGIFVPIYLWEFNEPLWRILFFYLLASFYFILIVPFFISIIKRLSDKLLMLISIPFLSIYFFGLNFLPQHPILFYTLPLFNAVSALLFNVGYHVDFSGASDDDALGREVGSRFLITELVRLGAPLLGGLIIASLGFFQAFSLSTSLLLLSTLPLFFFAPRSISPDVSMKSVFQYLKHKKLLPFTISGAGYAMETMVGVIIWPIFMFVVLGSIKELGGVISASLLGGAIITFIIGFLSDAGRRRRVVRWSGLGVVAIWFLRIFTKTPTAVAANQILGHTVGSSLMVGWTSQYYRLAKAVPSGSSFILSREFLYHFVRVPFLAFLMYLSAALPSNSFFSASFILAGLFSLLYLVANLTHTTSIKESF